MRTGRHLQRSVLFGDLVDHKQGGHQVGVGVRRVGEVLVPLHLGGRTGQLGVDLGVVDLDVGSDEGGHHVHHGAVHHDLVVGIGHLGRCRHPAQGRASRGVTGLHVEPGAPVQGLAPGFLVGTTLFHPAVKVGP